MRYQDLNSAAIDRWVEEGWIWGTPISHEDYLRAAAGDWSMVLTPTKPVPKHWFPELRGCRVLGLAAGGGQQMPVFCARGALCTVLDYSLLRTPDRERAHGRRAGRLRDTRRARGYDAAPALRGREL